MPIAIIVDWYGPYQGIDNFRKVIKDEWIGVTKCLYMALGKHNRIRYVGLTKSPGTRFQNHPNMENEENVRFYIGQIVSQGVAGRRGKKTRPDLDIAEHVLISQLDPVLNVKRKNGGFADCVSIYSRFFDSKTSEPKPKLAKFPEMIGYNSWNDSMRVVK